MEKMKKEKNMIIMVIKVMKENILMVVKNMKKEENIMNIDFVIFEGG